MPDPALMHYSTDDLYRMIQLLDMVKQGNGKDFEGDMSPQDIRDLEYLLETMQ